MNTAYIAEKSTVTPLARDARIPFYSLAFGMLASYLPGLFEGGVGVNISYLGWIIPLLGCGFVVLSNRTLMSFPLQIWLLWVLWILVYMFFAIEDNATQRSVMLLTPLMVGAAFSTLRIDSVLMHAAALWLRYFFWIFLAVAGVATGIMSGQIYESTGFAAGSITASLLATWFAARYTGGDKRALLYWALLSLIPVLANTRTGMIAVAMTLPLTLAPLPMFKRWLAVGVLVVSGLLVFQTERIQSKMFFSGHGTVMDAISGVGDLFAGDQAESGDFATSGRKSMNDVLVAGLDEAYWFGHGANTTEPISMYIASVTHPHNDWLRVRYEYGILGVFLFVITVLAQMWHAMRQRNILGGAESSIFIYAGVGAFIPMAIFMASDNVLLYAAWFGNLQFAMLGLGYAALRSAKVDAAQGVAA